MQGVKTDGFDVGRKAHTKLHPVWGRDANQPLWFSVPSLWLSV
jgi:hypothetical protein